MSRTGRLDFGIRRNDPGSFVRQASPRLGRQQPPIALATHAVYQNIRLKAAASANFFVCGRAVVRKFQTQPLAPRKKYRLLSFKWVIHCIYRRLAFG